MTDEDDEFVRIEKESLWRKRQIEENLGQPVYFKPKKEWVELTGEMLISAAQSCLSPHQYDHFESLLESDPEAHNRLAKAIEAKLKEKNHDVFIFCKKNSPIEKFAGDKNIQIIYIEELL